MNNKGGKILMWILSWAILALVVIYSPIGSPDLYTTKNYFVANQGVEFKSREIANSPNFNFGSDNNNEIVLPDYSSSELKSSNYAVGYYPTSNANSMASSYAVQSQNYQKTNNRSGSMGAGGATFISNNGSSGTNGSSTTVAMNNSITTLTSNLNVSNGTPRQNASASTNGGTDPGGDPTGPPIPVPDGWGFLLFLAAGYGIIKKYFLPV